MLYMSDWLQQTNFRCVFAKEGVPVRRSVCRSVTNWSELERLRVRDKGNEKKEEALAAVFIITVVSIPIPICIFTIRVTRGQWPMSYGPIGETLTWATGRRISSDSRISHRILELVSGSRNRIPDIRQYFAWCLWLDKWGCAHSRSSTENLTIWTSEWTNSWMNKFVNEVRKSPEESGNGPEHLENWDSVPVKVAIAMVKSH